MSTTEEIMKFISDNEDFLMKLYSETGRTNLGEFFINYLREKQKAQRADSMRNVMLPPSLIPISGVSTPQSYFPPQGPNP
jgi:hypothetical protein